MSNDLTPALLGSLARAALDNAAGLLDDAEVLLDAGRYPRALALTTLAAEEFGKHVACVSAAAFDLSNSAVVKKFWRRFRRHEPKYMNWHAQLITFLAFDFETGRLDPDVWKELIDELPDVVPEAMSAKMHALYVDFEDGRILQPNEAVSDELAQNAWQSVALVIKTAQNMWADADLSGFLESTVSTMQRLSKAMEEAKLRRDEGAFLELFADLFDVIGLSTDEQQKAMAELRLGLEEE